MQLSPAAHDAFKSDVLKRFPEEACGVICGGEYYPCTNVLDDKSRLGAFRIAPDERLRLTLERGEVEAVLHSHPYKLSDSRAFLKNHYNPAWPSVADQTSFMGDTCPWGIAATDGAGLGALVWLTDDLVPFEKREFNWFTADCYACIRDWHRQQGRILPNFTREWEFWKKGLNTIELGIDTISGAIRLPVEKAQIGDVAVFAIAGSIVNHLAVVSGPDEMLHQFVSRYAATDRFSKWAHKARHVVRFT